jgi:hypothetical protein
MPENSKVKVDVKTDRSSEEATEKTSADEIADEAACGRGTGFGKMLAQAEEEARAAHDRLLEGFRRV